MNRDDYILCIFIIAMVLLFVIALLGYAKTTAAAEEIDSETAQVTSTPDKPDASLVCCTIYNVPLSDELQMFTQAVCTEYGVPFELIIGIMWRESRFVADAVSGKDCIGLMQVNPCNADDLLAECDIYDLYEPCQNIRAGIHIFAGFYKKYGTAKALMCYCSGERGSKNEWAKGIENTNYTDDIIDYAKSLKVKYRIYEEATK